MSTKTIISKILLLTFIISLVSCSKNDNVRVIPNEGTRSNIVDEQDNALILINLDGKELSYANENDMLNNLSLLLNDKVSNATIQFKFNNDIQTVPLPTIGVSYDMVKINETIVNEKSKNPNNEVITLSSNDLPYTLNLESLHTFIANKEKEINKPPVNSTFSFNGDKLVIGPSTDSISLDSETFKSYIVSSINSKLFVEPIPIPLQNNRSTINELLLNNMTILSYFTTNILDNGAERTHNINLFLATLNGSVINTNETFSVDTKAGVRNESTGYKDAKGYEEGKIIQIEGGGICQPVTTIYNAALLANLEIIERSPHQCPVPYIEIGRDATIADNVKDLKFKNNTNNPIILQCYMTSDNMVKVNLWGINDNPNGKIEIEVKKLNDLESETYKKIYENDVLKDTILISKDKYVEAKKEDDKSN